MLIFLFACSSNDETSLGGGSEEMRINIVGSVTYKNNGSPAENVEIQLYRLSADILERIILKKTVTDQDGKYSISYYGKCSIYDASWTLKVRAYAPYGYNVEGPASKIIQCTSDTQTFDFQLIPKP